MRALRADVLAAGIHNSDSKVNICTVITVSSLIRVNIENKRTSEGIADSQATYSTFQAPFQCLLRCVKGARKGCVLFRCELAGPVQREECARKRY